MNILAGHEFTTKIGNRLSNPNFQKGTFFKINYVFQVTSASVQIRVNTKTKHSPCNIAKEFCSI